MAHLDVDTWSLGPLLGRVVSCLIDPTVVLSFDRTGYFVHSSMFRDEDLEVDVHGKVCLITGANAGIGFAAARTLARKGADVRLLCRDLQRGEEARERIRRGHRQAWVTVEQVDVSNLASVRDFVGRFGARPVDVLVNNAGVLLDHPALSVDGFELTWATNVVGPFLLTHLLLPNLRAAPAARVITVSSGGMYPTRLSLADTQFENRKFDGVAAYSMTKRAQVVLNELWAEHERGSSISFYAMHPGWANTPGVQTSLPAFHRLMRHALRTAAQGADTIVWLAICRHIAGNTGKFWFDRQPRRTHFVPWTREDPADRQRLWRLCCDHARIV